MSVELASWEGILRYIEERDANKEIRKFSSLCLKFNPMRGRSAANGKP